MPPENGRVLKTRIGMNPHSVGHGILFGSMAFVPYAVVSAFLIKACLSPSLDEALKQYRQRPSPGRLRRFVAACWGLSWLDFSGVWTFLMSRMVGAVSPYLPGSLSAALSVAVSYLAYRVTDEPPVAALTVRAAKLGLLPLSLGVLLALTYGAGGSGLPGLVLLCVAYGYLTPLAMILSGVAARLGGILEPGKKAACAGAAYVGGGLLALVLPPYPSGGYNPAGLLFPIWGWLLPACLTIIGLVRIAAGLFGRVNVSVDLPGGPRDGRVGLAESLRAVETLRGAGITAGINFILTAANIRNMDLLFREASRAGADTVMLLRPKPSGRGSSMYGEVMPDAGQQKSLLPLLLELEDKHHLPFHLDCALAPVLMRAGASADSLSFLGAYGCIAGVLLLTVDVEGFVRPCSHLGLRVCRVEDLPAVWAKPELWGGFRDRRPTFSGKCSSCDVAELCRGGCAAVKFRRGLSFSDPDPDLYCAGDLCTCDTIQS